MKFLILLITLCISQLAFGQLEQKFSGTYAPGINSPKNYVKNPNCEKNLLSITSSAGSFTRNTSTPLVVGAGAQCRWNPGASAATLKFDINAIDPSIKTGNCMASFSALNISSGDMVAYIEYDGVQVGSSVPVTPASATDVQNFQLNYPCSTSATTRKLVFSGAASPGVAHIGKVYFGESTNTFLTYIGSGPTIQKFTSGSGTYTTPAGVTYLRVKMVGGGGGGGGSGSTSTMGAGATGGSTTFGTSLLNAGGGGGGTANAGIGSSGTASLGTGPIGTVLSGGSGSAGAFGNSAQSAAGGGTGGSSAFGGGGGGGDAQGPTAGRAATPNTGAGGGGGGTANGYSGYSGSGGGSGGYIDAIITSPLSSYAYAVGAAGTAGTAGTSGSAGGAGAAGYIEVTEYYQ